MYQIGSTFMPHVIKSANIGTIYCVYTVSVPPACLPGSAVKAPG